MRQPIVLSHLFPTFCYFGRQNLFHEKESPFPDFVIPPALDQQTYGEFLHFGPGLGVFTLEKFFCTEEDSSVSVKESPFPDFVIPPALDQQTYGEFLHFGPGLGVFTLEKFFCTEEDSSVSVVGRISIIQTRQQSAQSSKTQVHERSSSCSSDSSSLSSDFEKKIEELKERSNVRVKKEVLSHEDSVTQESMECASRNQESSRNKSNNLSIQEKTEASRCSKRKRNKFYMQEDNMEDEKPSTPRRRDWYQTNVFPIIDTSDNSSSPTKTITRQFDPLYIDLVDDESSGPPRHDSYKTNIFSIMEHHISPPTTRIMMGKLIQM